MDHALDDATRSEFQPVLHDIGDHLKQHYGAGVFLRIAPAIEPWKPALRLEAYSPNTSTAALEIELDRANGFYATFGNGIECVLSEQHGWDDEDIARLKDRLTHVCDSGIELWRDRRRHLFGGRNVARVVGESFPDDVTAKHASRLSLAETTEPWRSPASHLVHDPAVDRGATAYFVDDRLPAPLRLVANETRKRFGSAISIVTHADSVNSPAVIEILPTNELAARVRVHAVGDDKVGLSAGQHQYFEYEYDKLTPPEAVDWLTEVGTHGLLETVRGKAAYYFVNHPATPEAISKVKADSKVTFSEVSPPWTSARAHILPTLE